MAAKFLIPATEVAEMCGGVSLKTVYRWEAKGEFKSCSSLRHKLYHIDDIAAFAARSTGRDVANKNGASKLNRVK
jgi:hypothetical protein